MRLNQISRILVHVNTFKEPPVPIRIGGAKKTINKKNSDSTDSGSSGSGSSNRSDDPSASASQSYEEYTREMRKNVSALEFARRCQVSQHSTQSRCNSKNYASTFLFISIITYQRPQTDNIVEWSH